MDEAVALNADAVARAQPVPIPLPPNMSEVYIYRPMQSQDVSPQPVTCGEQLVGTLAKGQFIHFLLSPGLYWLQSGAVPVRMKKADPNKFFPLRAEDGHSYYLRHIVQLPTSPPSQPLPQFEVVPETVGAEEMTEMVAPTWAVEPDLAVPGNSYLCKEILYSILPSVLQAQPGNEPIRDWGSVPYDRPVFGMGSVHLDAVLLGTESPGRSRSIGQRI